MKPLVQNPAEIYKPPSSYLKEASKEKEGRIVWDKTAFSTFPHQQP
jgi:hypothetical protein